MISVILHKIREEKDEEIKKKRRNKLHKLEKTLKENRMD